MSETRSFQIVDRTCSSRKEVYVSSLGQLIHDGREKFGLKENVKIVLECDGTIVDDEEYFATLDPNTCLMILKSDESWNVPSNRSNLKEDEVDFVTSDLSRLLERLKNDASQLIMLNDRELELLSEINPDVVNDVQDKNFLRDIQEACNLYLNDRRDAKDHIQLMRMYHEASHYSNINDYSVGSPHENIN